MKKKKSEIIIITIIVSRMRLHSSRYDDDVVQSKNKNQNLKRKKADGS